MTFRAAEMESQSIHMGPGLKSPSDHNPNAFFFFRKTPHSHGLSSGAQRPCWSNGKMTGEVDKSEGKPGVQGVRKTVIISDILQCFMVHEPFSVLQLISFWLHPCEEVSIIILILEIKKMKPSSAKSKTVRLLSFGRNGTWTWNFCTTSMLFGGSELTHPFIKACWPCRQRPEPAWEQWQAAFKTAVRV